MRILVTGGRDFPDLSFVHRILDAEHERHPISFVGEGGYRCEDGNGVDFFAHLWARARGVATATMHANWPLHGRAAGPIRNGQMLKFFTPEKVIAFPGGKGTANMVRQARDAGVEVVEYAP